MDVPVRWGWLQCPCRGISSCAVMRQIREPVASGASVRVGHCYPSRYVSLFPIYRKRRNRPPWILSNQLQCNFRIVSFLIFQILIIAWKKEDWMCFIGG